MSRRMQMRSAASGL